MERKERDPVSGYKNLAVKIFDWKRSFDGCLADPDCRDELVERIDRIFETITPREKELLRLRFGLTENESPLTYAEVGARLPNKSTGRLGLSVERARQLEASAFRKLRHPRRSQAIGELADD